jgi:hypothetical protein
VRHNESTPADLPSEDLRVDIALDWSPAQALAAYQWLAIVRDRIWLLYGQDIVRLLRDDTTPTTRPRAGDNDPPF